MTDKRCIYGLVSQKLNLGQVHRHGGILNRFDDSVFIANIDFRVKAVPEPEHPLGVLSRL
jgi:hypothetical protein